MDSRLRVNLKQGCKARAKIDPAQAAKSRRAASRATVFASFRNIAESPTALSPATPAEKPRAAAVLPPLPDRRQQLEKWKREKEEKERQLKAKEKPIFKLRTVINHTTYPAMIEVPKSTPYSGMATRSRTGKPSATANQAASSAGPKRAPPKPKSVLADIPVNKKFVAPKAVKPLPMLTIPQSPSFGKRKAGMAIRTLVNIPQQLLKQKFAEAKGRAVFSALASAPSPVRNVSFNPVGEQACFASPNVTVARGNWQQRKRAIEKSVADRTIPPKSIQVTSTLKLGADDTSCGTSPKMLIGSGIDHSLSKSVANSTVVPDPDIISHPSTSDVPMVEENTTPCSAIVDQKNEECKEKVKDALYYRSLLDTEIARLNKLCEQWNPTKISPPSAMSEEIQGVLDSAIGHTKLLIRSKFEQFRGLTVKCEAGTSTPPILVSDLEGFWDMLTIQIDNLDGEFQNLNLLKDNGWQKPQTAKVQPKKNAGPKKAISVQTNPVKPSGIRALMIAARKKQMADRALEEKFNTSVDFSNNCSQTNARLQEIKGTPERNSKRMSLLQGVLSSNAARRAERNSPIVMRVSLNGKSMGLLPVSNSQAADALPCISQLQHVVEPLVEPTVQAELDGVLFVKPSIPNTMLNAVPATRKSMSEGKPRKPRERKRLTMLQKLQRDSNLFDMKKAVTSEKFEKENDTFECSSTKIFSPRRSLRLTPYKNRRSASVDGRPSLMPMDNWPSPLPLPSGELISFDTPPMVRRSVRSKN